MPELSRVIQGAMEEGLTEAEAAAYALDSAPLEPAEPRRRRRRPEVECAGCGEAKPARGSCRNCEAE